MRLTVKWRTRNPTSIQKIRAKFGIPDYTTINGWSPVEIAEHDMPVLRECVRLRFLVIVPYTWRKDGRHISFDKKKDFVHN